MTATGVVGLLLAGAAGGSGQQPAGSSVPVASPATSSAPSAPAAPSAPSAPSALQAPSPTAGPDPSAVPGAAARTADRASRGAGERPDLEELLRARDADVPSPVAPHVPPPRPRLAPEVPDPSVVVVPSEPVAEPGSGLTGTEVVPDLGGVLDVVPGEVPAPGPGEVRTVRVEVERGLPVDGEVFAAAVLETLNDPRGWSSVDGVTFARTAGDAAIRVVLASPATTDRMCAPLRTVGRYSCGSAADGVAVLNFARWVTGAPDFGDDLATYRHYLVNHEVGHVLDHRHEYCPAPGALAPVMVQQTISTEGCVPNGWPRP